MQYCVNT